MLVPYPVRDSGCFFWHCASKVGTGQVGEQILHRWEELDVKNFFAKSWLKKIEEYTLVAGVSAEVDMAGLIGRGHNLLSGALPQAAFP